MEQLTGLVVIGGRSHDGDVHPVRVMHLVGINLGKDDLLGQAETVVAMAVETIGIYAAEVSNSRQGDRDQPIEELVHSQAAKSDLAADVVAFAKPETRDRGLGLGDHRLLTA